MNLMEIKTQEVLHILLRRCPRRTYNLRNMSDFVNWHLKTNKQYFVLELVTYLFQNVKKYKTSSKSSHKYTINQIYWLFMNIPDDLASILFSKCVFKRKAIRNNVDFNKILMFIHFTYFGIRRKKDTKRESNNQADSSVTFIAKKFNIQH
jgi:hypothetical protein